MYIYKNIFIIIIILYIYILYFSSFLSLSGIKIKNLFTLNKIYEKVITTLSPPSYYIKILLTILKLFLNISLYLYKHIWNIVPWDNKYATNNLLFRFIILVCTRVHYYMFVCVVYITKKDKSVFNTHTIISYNVCILF